MDTRFNFKKEAETKREVELAWSLKMKNKMKLGYSEKQIIGQIKERNRLDIMEALKINGLPFTDAGSVQNYLESVEVGDKEKQSSQIIREYEKRRNQINISRYYKPKNCPQFFTPP